jgi:hypothetical protein
MMRALVLALLVAGCATIPGDPSKMTAEQIKEAVKDKSYTMGCATVETPYKGNTILLNLDRGVLPPGSYGTITIGRDCSVTITSGRPGG